eukprot:1022295_1
MLYHKIWRCKRVGRAYRQKEIDKRVHKFFVYHPYRQNIRYSMKGQLTSKQIEDHELNYRLLRHQHGKRLKKISDVHSSLPRFNARCTYTGKDKVHNRWFRISTVPLRLMLKEGLIPGWERANW